MVATISPLELEALRRAGRPIDLIDVRTPAEFREVHVAFARNLPLDRLDAAALRQSAVEHPLYLVCRSGRRSAEACEQLMAAGVTQVVNVAGGTQACQAAGLPVVQGEPAMSLERQVRIAAGLLVLLGAAIGLGIHPYGFALAALVGAGLIFAGLTDSCGLAVLLGRMPWNQVAPPAAGGGCGSGCHTALLLLVGLGLLLPAASAAADHTPDSLGTVQRGIREQKAILVDVREAEEWEEGHLRDARLLPLSTLREANPATIGRALPKDKVIYLHCAAGGRCLQAAELLQKQGYDARPLKPGYEALLKAGFPAAMQ